MKLFSTSSEGRSPKISAASVTETPSPARFKSTKRITDTSRNCSWHIKELAESMGFQVLHGIVDCLWVIGEPISVFKEAVERETSILTEVDFYDWITFLPRAMEEELTTANLAGSTLAR